jgi:hypothetical protein
MPCGRIHDNHYVHVTNDYVNLIFNIMTHLIFHLVEELDGYFEWTKHLGQFRVHAIISNPSRQQI